MSTARSLFDPDPPPDPPPPPAEHTRHRWIRVVSWIAGAFTVLTLLVCVAIAVLLNSKAFHDYVLTKARSAATESLGARVELQNYALHFSPLGLDVYGVTVHGAAPYPDPPILQVQTAEVGIGIVSILQQKWYLSSLRVDHPVVQVFVDKNGNSNIPKPKSSSNSKSNTSIFDLGIRHAILDQGEVYYNAQKSALSADLHNVNFQAAFNEPLKMYSGNLSYANGHVLFGTYEPFEHNFDAQFDLTPTTFQLHHATISSGATRVNLVATATNFSAPTVDAQYDVAIDGSQFAKMTKNPSIPAGVIRGRGNAHYQDVANQPALNTLTVDGDLISQQLLVKTPSLRAAIDNIAAHYSLANGNVTLHDFRAGVLGGEITAQGTMKDLGGNSHSEMTANLRNISLADAAKLAGSKSAQPVNVSGVLNADAKASWGKTFDDLIAHTDATIHGSAPGKNAATAVPASAGNAPPPLPNTLPIDSEIHATY